jgi:hypothetical protein
MEDAEGMFGSLPTPAYQNLIVPKLDWIAAHVLPKFGVPWSCSRAVVHFYAKASARCG